MSLEIKDDHNDSVPNPYTITIMPVEISNDIPRPIDCIDLLYRQSSTPQAPMKAYLPKILKKHVDENIIDEVYDQLLKKKQVHKSSNILLLKSISHTNSLNE